MHSILTDMPLCYGAGLIYCEYIDGSFFSVYTELALYRFIEGDQSDLDKAENLYTEAEWFHKKVVNLMKKRNKETSEAAVHNLLSYAIEMRSWACLL